MKSKLVAKMVFGLLLWLLVVVSAHSFAQTFPVSTVDPAAVIKVKKKKDANKNFVISLTASNVVSPERLTPAYKLYVVWIVTKDKETKNIGQYGQKKSSKYKLTALSPVDIKEVFITAENEANTPYPLGLEISRVSVK